MRWIRPLTVVVFILSAIAFYGLQYYTQEYKDVDAPVISASTDSIRIGVKADQSALFQGMTASDKQDGDLTSQIVVESMGPMLSDGTRTVNYVVCDSANNLGSYSRTLSYKNYKSPKFKLKKQLRFEANKPFDVTEYLSVKDVLDGDLSQKIQTIYDGYMYYLSPSVGFYDLQYQVTNSAGDSADVTLRLEVYDPEEDKHKPTVSLNRYIVYLAKGEKFIPTKYIESVTVNNYTMEIDTTSRRKFAKEEVNIKGILGDYSNTTENERPTVLFYSDIYCDKNVDVNTPGSYVVTYSATTEDGFTGYAFLTVVVTE